jgi:PAS domain S-box-containing protein
MFLTTICKFLKILGRLPMNRHALQHRLFGVMVLLILTCAVSYTAILLKVRKDAILEEAEGKLLTAAECARANFKRQYLDRLPGNDFPLKEGYDQIVADNDALCRKLGLQYIWSVISVDGQFKFTSATHADLNDPLSDNAEFLEVHTDPMAFAPALSSMNPVYSTFHNKWGNGRMVLIPERDELGRIHIFCASIQLGGLDAMVRHTLLVSTVVSLMIVAFVIILSWLLARSLAAPIEKFTRDVHRITEGDLETALVPAGIFELQTLARSMESMRQKLNDQIKACNESESKTRAIVEQIPAIVYTEAVDETFTTLYISPQIESILGLQAKQCVESPDLWYTHLYPADRDQVMRQVAECHRSGAPLDIEYRMLSSDGQVVWFHDSGRIIRDNDGRAFVLQGVMVDITERKQFEEERVKHVKELARLAEQTQALAAALVCSEDNERKRLAHILHDDLQQLVIGARFFVESGLSADPGTRGSALADLKRASELLKQVLAVSRSLTSDLSPAILQQGLVSGLKWLCQKKLEDHRLQVTVEALPEAEPSSETARVLAFHAVRELLLNVVKHSGVLTACVALTRPHPDWVEVTVSDKGVGFNPEAALNAGDSRNGFGLHSIKQRLILSGGAFDVKSQPGQGAVFTLRIPDQPCCPQNAF